MKKGPYPILYKGTRYSSKRVLSLNLGIDESIIRHYLKTGVPYQGGLFVRLDRVGKKKFPDKMPYQEYLTMAGRKGLDITVRLPEERPDAGMIFRPAHKVDQESREG